MLKNERSFLTSNANPYSLGIQNKGNIVPKIVEEKGGEIFLRCKGAPLENEGTLRAANIQIEAEEARFENHHLISAKEGSISIFAFSDAVSLDGQKHIANYGTIESGNIKISAPKFINEGPILAEGGSISIFIPGTYIETTNSCIRGLGSSGTENSVKG